MIEVDGQGEGLEHQKNVQLLQSHQQKLETICGKISYGKRNKRPE